MSHENSYNKNYTSRRKIVEQNELYHVIIFPCDNSFSVVKSKQCTPSEQDGFVLVQSGGKRYTGFVFETGNMKKYDGSSRK